MTKLKVEELYLSPSNWESLHSQSRQFPPPTRASPLSSSSVSILKCLEWYVAAMIQQPRVPSSGLMPASDVLICAKVVITSRDILVGLLSKHTGNTVANVMRRPYYMDAPKAKEFGVIDRVSLCPVKLLCGAILIRTLVFDINSIALNSKAPEKVVFHLVTNEINYAAMKSWFAMNMDNLRGVTVEVQKFEDFKCLNASYVPMYSHLKQFTFLDLNLATRNFRPESLLGEGGFGCVFKGWVEENGTAPVKPGTGLTIPLIAASTSSCSLDPLNPQYSSAATCVFFDVARTFSKSNQELSPNPTVTMAYDFSDREVSCFLAELKDVLSGVAFA
ncbi:hypothetical protein HID58_070525 [Brassica napus]|uniref:Uncharacterized protein n=1 Tax=Brassica napus TaxID=3708 RepID=A0ABQ7YZ42_BRANA|nr:hypothetical protein HID58_070525 [Brassica napus]